MLGARCQWCYRNYSCYIYCIWIRTFYTKFTSLSIRITVDVYSQHFWAIIIPCGQHYLCCENVAFPVIDWFMMCECTLVGWFNITSVRVWWLKNAVHLKKIASALFQLEFDNCISKCVTTRVPCTRYRTRFMPFILPFYGDGDDDGECVWMIDMMLHRNF